VAIWARVSRFASFAARAVNACMHALLLTLPLLTCFPGEVAMMKTKLSKNVLAAAIASAWIASSVASADDLFAYPPEGRSKQQQEKDRFECHQWAVEQSKFDPVQYAANGGATASSTAPLAGSLPSASTSSAADTRSVTKGPDGRALFGGAAQGAAIAAVAGGDVGDAAATGAGLGLIRAKRAQRAAEALKIQSQQQAQLQAAIQAQQQTSASAQDLRNKQQNYQRARATCFKARGYTVSEG
jgi:hypothetical protein